MHFGEYELFPGLIGLSPLPTGRPKTFQRQRVRPSTVRYHCFGLPMGRSPGFASATADSTYGRDLSRPYRALLRLALAAAPPLRGLTLPAKATRRLIMQKARRHPGCPGLRPLVGAWFQDLFHSVVHGSFHLSLTVLVRYRSPRSI